MRLALRNRIVRAAATLEGLDEVHDALIPALASLAHASLVFAYRGTSDAEGVRAYLPPDTPNFVADYFAEYVADCPLHAVKERISGDVVPTTALYGFTQLNRTRVYNELWRPWGFDHHVALRFDDGTATTPELASLGLMINRDRRRGEYAKSELEDLRSIAPDVRGALRRAARVDALEERVASLEALVDAPHATATVVLDADGRVLHVRASADADAIIRGLRQARHPLRLAVRRLVSRRDDEPLVLEHQVDDGAGQRWRASIALKERGPFVRPLVVVSLSPLGWPKSWARWRLTPAESSVLAELVAGHTNTEIGARLFISPETVRTHLTRIYKKLGVGSRLEAVVKAGVRGTA